MNKPVTLEGVTGFFNIQEMQADSDGIPQPN
jgi:hypothetical protein